MKLIKLSIISLVIFTASANAQHPVTISINQNAAKSDVVRYAAKELLRDFQQLEGEPAVIQIADHITGKNRKTTKASIELSIVPESGLKGSGNKTLPENFQISAKSDGSVKITGVDATGTLWGVRDFTHYYAKAWLSALKTQSPMVMDIKSSPAIQNRGLWSWWHGCYDPYAYIDRASEWKLNVVTFWNRGVPVDADRLNAYAHQRGVRLWWGFSWGWIADDFKDASPDLAKRLLSIYDRQRKEIGPGLNNLCPYDEETPKALMDYVLDVYSKQYAWIPNIDGIYFQTATESTCPCAKCKAHPRGEGFIRTILPIIKELHRRYPKLLISCGVHNTGDLETFKALKQIPDYCNICWEDGVTWAPSRQVALDQMTYRGSNEDFAGVYRITMNCGLDVRGTEIRNEPARIWLPRVDKLWDYIEEGQPEGSGKGFRSFSVNGVEVGYPCTSDWRPSTGGREVDNPNFQQLLNWSRDLAKGPARTKGVFLLVEAGMIDLKMRRVPAMAAEVIWNPKINEEELQRRCGMIWSRQVGAWNETINPFWKMNAESSVIKRDMQNPGDLGNIYHQMDSTGKKN